MHFAFFPRVVSVSLMRRVLCLTLAATWCACGTPPAPNPPTDGGNTNADASVTLDAGALDAGSDSDAGSETDAGTEMDAGTSDAGMTTDAGALAVDWRFIPIAGSQCARGAQTGFGYAPGSQRQLVLYLQGGGACWNTGTCQPSLQQWGPVCNYGSNSVCFWDQPGGTKPLAVFVADQNPFPSDGGGAFPNELGSVKNSILFSRRADNPLRDASFAFVPYCTGDLHAGDATVTYMVKPDLVTPPVAVQHHFAGARNMDLFLADLRARHPQLDTVWLIGVSGGGYGASLNLHRVRAAFPEAEVHLLADSSPMLDSPHYDAWKAAWNLQLPPGCGSACDAGLAGVMERELDLAAGTRTALLAFEEDQVITRFFYSGDDTNSWLNPPYATYDQNLDLALARYDARTNAEYFVLRGQEHVMLAGYGVVQGDGGVTTPRRSIDGGSSLKEWVDAWATGTGSWPSVH